MYKNGEDFDKNFNSGVWYDIVIRSLGKFSIVIVSKNLDYAFNGYALGSYLRKPLSYDNFTFEFDRLYSLLKMKKNNMYVIHSKENGIIRINLEDISYFESFGRKISLHSGKKSISFYGNLTEEDAKLMNYNFVRIHKSFLVNMYCITQLNRLEISLNDGTILPVSKQRHKIVFDRFTEFLINNPERNLLPDNVLRVVGSEKV